MKIFSHSQYFGILSIFLMGLGIVFIPKMFLSKKKLEVIAMEEVYILPQQKKIITPKKVNINKADTNELKSVRGIGSYFAYRIVKYRNRLGGYYSIKQLNELKLKHLKIENIEKQITVDDKDIIKKDLDTMSFKSVLRHPYLNYEDVKLIFNAKRKHKKISMKIIMENGVLPKHKIEKISHYYR